MPVSLSADGLKEFRADSHQVFHDKMIMIVHEVKCINASLTPQALPYVPLSQITISPAPYWPSGICPWKSMKLRSWSSTATARRFCRGSREGPLGKAHDLRTPAISSLKSKCRCDAWCSCTTKRRTLVSNLLLFEWTELFIRAFIKCIRKFNRVHHLFGTNR